MKSPWLAALLLLLLAPGAMALPPRYVNKVLGFSVAEMPDWIMLPMASNSRDADKLDVVLFEAPTAVEGFRPVLTVGVSIDSSANADVTEALAQDMAHRQNHEVLGWIPYENGPLVGGRWLEQHQTAHGLKVKSLVTMTRRGSLVVNISGTAPTREFAQYQALFKAEADSFQLQ